MGWKGGGIGKKENGRTEIVGVSCHLFHSKTDHNNDFRDAY